MKTSRIARETARITQRLAQDDIVPRRQTRAFAASLSAFTANGAPLQDDSENVKQEDTSNSDSSLSSLHSAAGFDIEDAVIKASPSRKRKRGLETPSTTVTTVSTTTSTRTSPRKSAAGEKPKKAKRQPAKQTINEAGEVEIHPPANWQEIYDAVKEMRKKVLAPVDTMGCETLAEEHLSPRVRLSLLFLSPSESLIRSSGQALPNPHRTNALVPNQRHYQRHRYAPLANRTSLTRAHAREYPRC